MGFAKMGADGSCVSTFCFLIWPHILQDDNKFSYQLLFINLASVN